MVEAADGKTVKQAFGHLIKKDAAADGSNHTSELLLRVLAEVCANYVESELSALVVF